MLGLNDERDSLMLREWKVDMCVECAGEKRSDANSLLSSFTLTRTR